MAPAAALPVAKLLGVFAKQIAKPVAEVLKKQSKESTHLRSGCIMIGQMKHRVGVYLQRMSLDSHKDQEVQHTCSWWPEDLKLPDGRTEREEIIKLRGGTLKCRANQVVRVLKQGPGLFPLDSQRGPMQLVEWKSRISGETCRGWIWTNTPDGRLILKSNVVKPLADEDAIESGTTLIGEVFIFSVSATIAILEYLRSSEKSSAKEAKIHAAEQAKEEALQRDMARRDEQITKLMVDVSQWQAEASRLSQTCENVRAENDKVQKELQRVARITTYTALAAVAMVPLTALLQAFSRRSSG